MTHENSLKNATGKGSTMFITQQYNFQWNDAYFDAFMSYNAPVGIEGYRADVGFANVWDNL